MDTIDLSKCRKGDILISSQGAKLEYIAPTPYDHYTYLDHVVRYIEDKDGNSFGDDNFGTRTNDGFVFAKSRCPDSDHDIVKIIPLRDDVKVDIVQRDDKINLLFTSNCGKFGTDEILDEYDISAKDLLYLLQNNL